MDKPLADVLAESREYIEEHGWTKGILLDGDGRVCSLGGVVISQNWMVSGEIAGRHMADVNLVSEALVRAIHPEAKGLAMQPMFPGQWLTMWNDNHAENKQAVLDAFAKAEKIERAGFDPDE